MIKTGEAKMPIPDKPAGFALYFDDVRIGYRFHLFATKLGSQRIQEQADDIAMREDGCRAVGTLRNTGNRPAHT